MFRCLLLFFPLWLLAGCPEFIILIGAPGSGKGTQAAIFSEQLQLPHISVGDLLRSEIEANTALGQSAKECMQRGELVPDSLALTMLQERLKQPDCSRGAILDGTSRKLSQAEFLLSILPSGKLTVLYFNIDFEELQERILQRMTCSQCGATYHPVAHPESKTGQCDTCQSRLIHRSDDNSLALMNRLDIFQKNINGVLAFYGEKNILYYLDAAQEIQTVSFQISQILGFETTRAF